MFIVLALDKKEENLYFSDVYNGRIRKVNLLTNNITTFVEIYYSFSLNFDANVNYLYFSMFYFIKKINMITNIVTTVAGNGYHGYNGDNIAATSANISADFLTLKKSV